MGTQFQKGRNILVKSNKKNEVIVCVCAVIVTLASGMIAGCSLTENNSAGTRTDGELSDNNMKSQIVQEQTEQPGEPVQEDTADTEESVSYDEQEIRRITEEFAAAYFDGDAEGIRIFLSVPFEGDIEVYTGTGTISEISLKGLEDTGEQENESVQIVFVEYMDSSIGDSYRYLTLKFVRQENEWKVQFYGIEG